MTLPEAENVASDKGREALYNVHIEGAWELEQAENMAEYEQYTCDNELGKEEEKGCFGFVEHPFVPVTGQFRPKKR